MMNPDETQQSHYAENIAKKIAEPPAEPLECCSGEHAVAPTAGPAHESPGATEDVGALFKNFMKAASQEGLLDKRTKKILGVALSVAQRCQPCLKIHIQTALAMGITKAEIDEAAWLAIGFAGSPSMMLYQAVCQELGI